MQDGRPEFLPDDPQLERGSSNPFPTPRQRWKEATGSWTCTKCHKFHTVSHQVPRDYTRQTFDVFSTCSCGTSKTVQCQVHERTY